MKISFAVLLLLGVEAVNLDKLGLPPRGHAKGLAQTKAKDWNIVGLVNPEEYAKPMMAALEEQNMHDTT